MDPATYFLGLAGLVAAIAAIPRSPFRPLSIFACIVLFLAATGFFIHSEIQGNTTASASGAQQIPSDSPAPAITTPEPDQVGNTAGSNPSDSPTGNPSPSSTTFVSAPPSPTKVTLAELCDSPGDENAYICGGSYGGTVQVGQNLFTYYGENNGFADAETPNWDLVLQFAANTCSNIKLNFATDDSKSSPSLQVVQTSTSPVTVSTSPGTIGTLETKLDGGPFKIQAASSDGSEVYVNGYATCTTQSGQ